MESKNILHLLYACSSMTTRHCILIYFVDYPVLLICNQIKLRCFISQTNRQRGCCFDRRIFVFSFNLCNVLRRKPYDKTKLLCRNYKEENL